MMMENGMGKLAQACKELVEENYTILSRVSKKTPQCTFQNHDT